MWAPWAPRYESEARSLKFPRFVGLLNVAERSRNFSSGPHSRADEPAAEGIQLGSVSNHGGVRMRRFTLLATMALGGAILAGVARADTIVISCASSNGSDEERITLDTRGFVTVSTGKGDRRYQARVTDDLIDYVVDRQPYVSTEHRVDRRTGTDYLTIFSYRLNSRTYAKRVCRKVSTSNNAF